MRRITIGMVLVVSTALAGCGGGGQHFANQPRPPSPVDVSIYINDQRVSVSPSALGAGPVVFTVTNSASQAESMKILPAGVTSAKPLADTGPISPQATAQLQVNFRPGDFVVAAISDASDASSAAPSGIKPALLRIGAERPSSSSQLLSP